MKDADILGLICSIVLYGPIPDEQGIKTVSEETLNCVSLDISQVTNGLKKEPL